MPVRALLRLAVFLPLLLAACGDLPEPFLGNPGATARRLAVPSTPLLVVPPPTDALLPAASGADFADLLALSLQKEEVPSLAQQPHKGDWRLAVTAERRGDAVVPRYAVQDPAGKEQGAVDGAAFPASAWTSGAPWTLGQASKDAVPKVIALMMSLRATRDRANPNSLLNRPAKVYVPEVTGAPGDGNFSLTRLMRARLAEFGPMVQVTPEGADFIVKGQVTMTPIPNKQQRVEVVWTVTRPSGVVNGKVSQLNNVPAGTLDLYWGDIAGAVTQEASGGVEDVIERFIGKKDAAAGGTPAAAPGASPGGSAPAPAGSAPAQTPAGKSSSGTSVAPGGVVPAVAAASSALPAVGSGPPGKGAGSAAGGKRGTPAGSASGGQSPAAKSSGAAAVGLAKSASGAPGPAGKPSTVRKPPVVPVAATSPGTVAPGVPPVAASARPVTARKPAVKPAPDLSAPAAR